MFWSIFESALKWPDELRDQLAEGINSIIRICCMPFSFDWSAPLMTTFQGVAIGIVALIVILRGIFTGILLEGGSEDESVGHYLFTSLVPVAIIAATPAITSALAGATTSLVCAFTNQNLGLPTINGYMDLIARDGVGLGDLLLEVVFLLVMGYYIICICMQCLRRWIQLEVLSVIMPLVAVMTALEDSSDFLTLMKSMLFSGVVTVLQLAGFCSVGALSSWAASMPGIPGSCSLFVVVAAFGAIKQIPSWVEKYTYVGSAAGHGNGASHFIYAARGFSGRGTTSVARAAMPKTSARAALAASGKAA